MKNMDDDWGYPQFQETSIYTTLPNRHTEEAMIYWVGHLFLKGPGSPLSAVAPTGLPPFRVSHVSFP